MIQIKPLSWSGPGARFAYKSGFRLQWEAVSPVKYYSVNYVEWNADARPGYLTMPYKAAPELLAALKEAEAHIKRASGGGASGPFHIDHVLAVANGGTDALDNLVVACKPCNLSKGSKTVEEWL